MTLSTTTKILSGAIKFTRTLLEVQDLAAAVELPVRDDRVSKLFAAIEVSSRITVLALAASEALVDSKDHLTKAKLKHFESRIRSYIIATSLGRGYVRAMNVPHAIAKQAGILPTEFVASLRNSYQRDEHLLQVNYDPIIDNAEGLEQGINYLQDRQKSAAKLEILLRTHIASASIGIVAQVIHDFFNPPGDDGPQDPHNNQQPHNQPFWPGGDFPGDDEPGVPPDNLEFSKRDVKDISNTAFKSAAAGIFQLSVEDFIPANLFKDSVLGVFICGISKAPIRHVVRIRGESVLYEKVNLENALKKKSVSPSSQKQVCLSDIESISLTQRKIDERLDFLKGEYINCIDRLSDDFINQLKANQETLNVTNL